MLAQFNYSLSINQYLQAKHKVKELNGVILVAKNNTIVYQQAIGLADRENARHCDNATAFVLGAMSERFIAAAILLLEEEGKLKTSDPIARYLPQFNRGDFYKGSTIRIHQLLIHTSGLADLKEWSEIKLKNDEYISRDSLLLLITSKNMIEDPGRNVRHNKTDYFVLECLIEKLSGKTYSDFIKERIFSVAGLTESGFFYSDFQPGFVSKSYRQVKEENFVKEPLEVYFPLSATQMYTTAGDLFKWHNSFYDTLFLSSSSNKRMHTVYTGLNGYGVIIDTYNKALRYYNTGAIAGFNSCFLQIPFEGICIVVLLNSGGNALAISEALSSLLMNISLELPYVHKEVKLKSKQLKRFEGVYPGHFNMEIKLISGKLYRTIGGLKTVELRPESATKLFFADGTDRQLEFLFNDKDELIRLWQIKNSVKEEIKLVK